MNGVVRSLAALAFVVAAAAALPVPAAIAGPVAVDLELVLAVDVSGSIDADEAQLQRRGYVDAITDPEVIRAIRSGVTGRIAITYFEWAGDGWQVPVIDWTVIDGEATAKAFSQRLAAAPMGAGPWTSISDAINFAVPLFGAGGFTGARRIIDISGDGANNTGGSVTVARDAAVARRITINGLPIINDRPNLSRMPMPNLDLYYENCVIGGPGAFIVVARGFKAFAQAIRRKLILEIAGLERPDRTPAGRAAPGFAQAGGGPPDSRWAPPCNEGERRFRGVIQDP
jgi:hypothetical protein